MPNVLLISFDTLRADVAYSCKFPTMNRLLRRGSTFSTAVASAPLTPPSHATVLSGLQPPNHGLRHLFREKIDDDVTMLAEYLVRSGYRTGAITSCPGLNRWYGFDRGFQTFDDEIPLLADGTDPLQTVDVKLRGTALKRGDIVADRAISWLEEGEGEDFFLFVHFFDSHWPYEAPADYGVEVANAYEGEVAYMDHHLGRILDWLEQRGLLEDLAIVFFSDHGEDLDGLYPNDKGGDRGHPEEEGHGALLFDQTQLVALSISWPGHVPEGQWFGNQVRLVDITPTILDICGFHDPAGLDGKSLMPILRGEELGHRPAYFETFYREEISASRNGFDDLRPLAGVRLDDKWKVVWEPAGTRSVVSVFALDDDAGEWRPDLAMGAQPPQVPVFAPNAFDQVALRSFLGRASSVVPGAATLEPLIAALGARNDLGLTVRGSLATNTADAQSDVDLELVFPSYRPGPQDFAWLREAVGSVADVLAHFPATHLDMPQLQIFFCAVPEGVLKLDIMCLGPGDPEDVGKPGMILRAPAGRMPTVRRFDPPPFDIHLAWQRLLGWTWYCATKIQRSELFEANDNLAAIRNEILIPMLMETTNQQPMGCRWLERKLPDDILPALEATIPGRLEREALAVALWAAVDLGQSQLPVLADRRGTSLDRVTADALFSRVRNAIGDLRSVPARHAGMGF